MDFIGQTRLSGLTLGAFINSTRKNQVVYSFSYRVSLSNRIVLRRVMQCCRLFGKGEFSASIGTAGDCCAVSGGQVEVHQVRVYYLSKLKALHICVLLQW